MKASALEIVRSDEAERQADDRWSAQQQRLAETAVLIPAEERSNALEYVGRGEYVPPCWDGPHVSLRLIGAFKTLARLPLGRLLPSNHSGHWPPYAYEWADLLAQRQAEASDIELQEHLSNRVRIPPSAKDVSRMETALVWPAHYLIGQSIIMRAVQRIAAARARDIDMDRIARRLRYSPPHLRRLNRAGLDAIAVGLRLDNVAVF